MLIREDPATELTVATRILARAGALAETDRVTLRAGEVCYVSARGVSNHTMTPYDVAIVRIADGIVLWSEPPADVERYLVEYRRDVRLGAVIATKRGMVNGAALHVSAVRALGEHDVPGDADAVEAAWRRLVVEARSNGTLIGAFPHGADER